MANKQQLKRTASSSNTTKRQTTTKTRSSEGGVSKPKFGDKNQRWLSEIGGASFVCKNPFPISYRDNNGEIVNDTVVYGEGNNTIWKSEANGELTRDAIVFKNRVFIASQDNPLLQEYFWAITQLGGYKDIQLEDKEAEAESELEKYELQDANTDIIRKASFGYKKAIYRAMGGVLEPSANDKAVTARLRKTNEANPQKLHQALHRENVEVEYVCEEVISKGYVVQKGDKVYWLGKNKTTENFITNVVAGRFNSDVLANLMASDKAFKEKWLKIFSEAIDE